jgi:hypothetical protein
MPRNRYTVRTLPPMNHVTTTDHARQSSQTDLCRSATASRHPMDAKLV